MKQCYHTLAQPSEVDEIVSKGLDSISNNPDSIELFKEVDKKTITEFLQRVIYGLEDDYLLMTFKDSTDNHIVGVCLFSRGSPWYNPWLRVFNEECTIAFESGYGITRKVAEFLEKLLKDGFTDVVQTSSANDCVAKLIENTYTKYGFKQYKSYYKCR